MHQIKWRERIQLLSLVMQAGYPPVILWGPPGVGKTSIVRKIAEKFGMRVFPVLASSKDPADVLGVDWVQGDRTLKFPPKWVLESNELAKEGKRSVVFLDEITTAPHMVQNVLLSTVQDRLVGETYLDEKVYVLAAGNPENVTGESLSQALANRFLHLNWSYDIEAFLAYLRNEDNITPFILEVNSQRDVKYQSLKELLALYIKYIKDIGLCEPALDEQKSRPYPSPRSLDNMLKALSLVPDDGNNYENLEDAIALSAVGAEGVGFTTWLRKKNEIPSAEAILFDGYNLPPGRTDLAILVINVIYNYIRDKNDEFVWDAVFMFADKFIEEYLHLAVPLAEYLLKADRERKGGNGGPDRRFYNSKLAKVLSKITSTESLIYGRQN